MIPIFCDRGFHFLAGTQLDRIRAANEYRGKNKAADGRPKISTSIHATNSAITQSAHNGPSFSGAAPVAMVIGNSSAISVRLRHDAQAVR